MKRQGPHQCRIKVERTGSGLVPEPNRAGAEVRGEQQPWLDKEETNKPRTSPANRAQRIN
jgi:hypothetical protein